MTNDERQRMESLPCALILNFVLDSAVATSAESVYAVFL